MTRTLLTRRQVAEKMGHAYHWFDKARREKLEAQGFPAPVPACGLRWDAAAIDAWLDGLNNRVTVSIAPPPDIARELRDRAQRVAAGETPWPRVRPSGAPGAPDDPKGGAR